MPPKVYDGSHRVVVLFLPNLQDMVFSSRSSSIPLFPLFRQFPLFKQWWENPVNAFPPPGDILRLTLDSCGA